MSADLVRQEVTALASTLVVKVGSRVLTRDDGTLDEDRIGTFAEQIHQLMAAGRRVVLVSSGAVAAGRGQLRLTERPKDLALLQAVAAVGQSFLVQAYDRALRRHNRHAAQILLTTDDLNFRVRYLNVRNTIHALFELEAVPIINENDTVAVDELQTTFGDNDRLAAMVTNLLRAPLLVLLSDVEGLYDGDPAEAGSKLIPTVTRLDASVLSLVRDRATGLSKGGMASKLEAARMATVAGENVIIASGRRPNVLLDIMAGEPVGTLVLAQGQTVASRKRWIGFTAQPHGHLVCDDGARRAVVERGGSLLAIGIKSADGTFRKGDVVRLRDLTGQEFARGLVNYSSDEIAQIAGLRSDAIAERLGHVPYEEVIHRDNMALTGGG